MGLLEDLQTQTTAKRAAVFDFIQSCLPTDFAIFDAAQSIQRPTPPYVVFDLITGLSNIGSHMDEKRYVAPDGQPDDLLLTVHAQRTQTLNIQAIGKITPDDQLNDEPSNYLEAIKIGSQFDDNRKFLVDCGLGILGITPVQILNQFLEADIEPRATMDLFISSTYLLSTQATAIAEIGTIVKT